MYKIRLLVRTLILIKAITLAALFVSYRAGVFRLDLVAQETNSNKKEAATALATPTKMVAPKDGAFLGSSKSAPVFVGRSPEVPEMAGATETMTALYKELVSSKSMPDFVGGPLEVATVAATPRASVPK
jgi:hypothetical protein